MSSSSSRTHQLAVRNDGSANSIVLILTSVLLLHTGIQDGSGQPWIEWVELLSTLLLAAFAYPLVRKSSKAEAVNTSIPQVEISSRRESQQSLASRTTVGELFFLALFCGLPFVTDVFLRQLADHGNPLEIQLTFAIRNLMFLLAISPRYGTGRFAAFTSLFLAIYGGLISVSPLTYGLIAVYALCGLWWLMANYWQRISARFPDESSIEIPVFARVGAIGLVMIGLVVGAFATQSSAVTGALAGFMPSSGGAGGNDPFARGGIGDGDQMVGATEDASSFGPVESELFLESKQPSLYDMFTENYDPPAPKKRKRGSRAIPLSPQTNQKQNHRKLAKNEKSTREFSAIRRKSRTRKRQKLEGTKSAALLYVAGRTPLHLGLAIYDHWDGQNLSLQGELPEYDMRLKVDESQRNWATWQKPAGRDPEAVAEERHLLKIINLKSAIVPCPPNQTAIHIDKLHDARFFRWEDGLLRIAGEKIPSLSVLHVASEQFHRHQLPNLELSRSAGLGPAGTSSRLAKLAKEWTSEATSDWECVKAICENLRTFEVAPKLHVPEDTEDAVEHFLFVSRAGPDFLFATSAAVLLRTLGYECRVLSGLYADPENYDRLAKSTGIFAGNVHFWGEVRTSDGRWLVVEPTPGFEVLYARQTLSQHFASMLNGLADHVQRYSMYYLATVICISLCVVFRERLFALAATGWWWLGLASAPRQQVKNSVWLLQRISRKSGRQAGQTLDQWIAGLSESSQQETDAIAAFRMLVSWACYATSDELNIPAATVRQTCVDSVGILRKKV